MRLAPLLVTGCCSAAVPGTADHATTAATDAENEFMRALLWRCDQTPEQALRKLEDSGLSADPNDARTHLLVGLGNLWVGDEQHATAEERAPFLTRAIAHFGRSRDLAGGAADYRIPSWQIPAEWFLHPEWSETQKRHVFDTLEGHSVSDLCFHSIGLAVIGFSEPRGTPRFERGLAVLRRNRDLTACRDAESTYRWYYKSLGYSLFLADYEMKAGNVENARDRLNEMPYAFFLEYPTWPFQDERQARIDGLDERVKRYADGDPANDPPPIVSAPGVACRVCHARSR